MANANQMVVKLKITADSSQAIGEVLSEIKGVVKVEQMTPQRLRITYDVNQTGWAMLRGRLQKAGVDTQKSLFTRWRDNWREFIEQNMRDNLRHTPACCSKVPVGGGLRSHTNRDK
ncbi:MAG: hypothetical protein GC149_16845 [Gammaproteobacteria bacterium]|nr:hypothetical protein [Gammaproteobacteria bacterium]